MADVVRVGPILRACLEVLREEPGPLHGREVLDEVDRRLELTSYEKEIYSDGVTRWRNHMNWWTGDVATVGWMTKRDGRWSLTEAGIAALDTYDPDEFATELKRRYQEIRRHRQRAVEELAGEQQLIADALSVVDAGSWTSFGDVAELVGSSAESVQHFLAGSKRGLPGAYRVLLEDGKVPGEGMLHMDHRGGDIRARLRSEGVDFDVMSRAAPTQRVTADGLRARLRDLAPAESESQATRAWLVRGSSVEGRDLVPVWLHKGTVSLAAASLRPVTAPVGVDELRRAVEEDYGYKSYAVREAKVAEFDAFCNRMRPGDHVLTTSQGKAYLGRVTGDAAYLQSSDNRSNLRRAVEWLNPTNPVPFPRLPQPLPAKLHSQSDVVELTEDIAAVEALLAGLGVEHSDPLPELRFPPITAELADELLIDVEWLERQADLLWERRQVILYGPPGTGKTWLARALAGHLADPSAVKLVQFHPSYTYEDFFEGFRPAQQAGGQLAFELRPGPFRRLVEAARDNPSDPYVLIIDEINRANLAKVFGELYFLLEYRDDAVGLLYSPEANFTLPKNVFVIGTMNTADRSIALVDAAMRRRFGFVELHPSTPPTAGLLTAWLTRLGKDEDLPYNLDAPQLLDELNARIGERDFAVGPSYLMRAEVYRRADGLDQVWETSLLPLLEELHFGSPPEVLDRYRLPALRAALAARPGPDGLSAGAP